MSDRVVVVLCCKGRLPRVLGTSGFARVLVKIIDGLYVCLRSVFVSDVAAMDWSKASPHWCGQQPVRLLEKAGPVTVMYWSYRCNNE